jgi:Na+/phosphate symporter
VRVTATGLLATSFTATGVMALAPALAVMLGANVGTSLLAQLLSFNMALVGPPLVLIGVLAFRWAIVGRAKNIGRIAIGLGLSLVEFSLRNSKRGKRLCQEEIDIVAAMHTALVDCLRLALAVFLQGERVDAERLVGSKTAFREFEAAAMTLSVRLLRTAAGGVRAAEADTMERVAEESGVFLRSVRDLRRIHSHLATFAYPILHRSRDSQLTVPDAAAPAILPTTVVL